MIETQKTPAYKLKIIDIGLYDSKIILLGTCTFNKQEKINRKIQNSMIQKSQQIILFFLFNNLFTDCSYILTI